MIGNFDHMVPLRTDLGCSNDNSDDLGCGNDNLDDSSSPGGNDPAHHPQSSDCPSYLESHRPATTLSVPGISAYSQSLPPPPGTLPHPTFATLMRRVRASMVLAMEHALPFQYLGTLRIQGHAGAHRAATEEEEGRLLFQVGTFFLI